MNVLQVVVARCLTYLDNGVVFVGSTYGDSNVVKVLLCNHDLHSSGTTEVFVIWLAHARM